ncbi:MAG: hypothetical protein GEU79_10645 [Acidimicrobiia bacterium]|nr:hypothetical protein [Acidimicrobiia bacterium]
MRRLLLSVVLLMALATQAGAEPCPPGEGVTVVVDATVLDAGVTIACAPGPVDTGLHALDAAGFKVEGTSRFATFVCRIDGQPSQEQDPCVDTPSASAFWGYWHAERGGSWQSTDLGAASHQPIPGGVEGWVFGSDDEPSATVPADPTITTGPENTVLTLTTNDTSTTTAMATSPAPVSSVTVADEPGDVDGPWPTILTVVGVGLVGAILLVLRRGRDDV